MVKSVDVLLQQTALLRPLAVTQVLFFHLTFQTNHLGDVTLLKKQNVYIRHTLLRPAGRTCRLTDTLHMMLDGGWYWLDLLAMLSII